MFKNRIAQMFVSAALLIAASLPALTQAEELAFGINPDKSNLRTDSDKDAYQSAYKALADYLSTATGAPLAMSVKADTSKLMIETRSGRYDILMAPSHVIGSAIKYGYEPVAKLAGSKKAVFVALKDSGITNLQQAKGKRLGLPDDDALPTYLARGELNALGFTPKSYFSEVNYNDGRGATLTSLGYQQIDVAVADASVVKQWLTKNPGVIIAESDAVPEFSVAVNVKLPKDTQEKIRNALLQLKPTGALAALSKTNITGFTAATRADYEYIGTLGYFTPRSLLGAKVVTAEQAKTLAAQGAIIVDTRSASEFKTGRIKDAVNLPYKENSEKAVDFDSTLDKLDLSALPADKATPIIFACNGAECWKSYKGAKLAINAQYTKVYWLRGGFPEWKARGYPIVEE